ncbi:glutamate synthase large subunit [Termitidicoccus mucosus]|uniref:Glutamate synthase [NADPH] large chain n=1 Tax=Termitidicoccus mucosus TaxID=1184151 RepID=A0A178IHC4_9BACT|nr:glutamate synthase subunit alpha [Opitutaceae bacterium TSB47]
MARILPSPFYHPEQEHDACGVGFVARLSGERSTDVVHRAITALRSLAHRGAIDADAITGDGAGILTQIPHELFRHFLDTHNIPLARDTDLGVGMIFLPPDDEPAQARGRAIIEEAVRAEGLAWLCWRDVPVGPGCLGRKAADTLPLITQALVARAGGMGDDEFERRLFLAQKTIERRAGEAKLAGLYLCSFSSRTIVYKGLLTPAQIRPFYPDLKSPRFTSSFAIFHQRYSTNTFPNWHLAHPFRMLAHNGEINTIRGNRNLMRARQRAAAHGVWGARFPDLHPLVQPGASDSASFDNALQLLTLGGRSPLEAIMLLMPEAWEKNPRLSDADRAFHRYHSCMIEPWDGPAAMVFTDGKILGASLDRNGLRPARYKIYDDGYVILGSEAGLVHDFPGKVVESGRLGPGRMIAIDLAEKKFYRDAELKSRFTANPRYLDWCAARLINLGEFLKNETDPKNGVGEADCPPSSSKPACADGEAALSAADSSLLRHQIAFGYDLDERELILAPLAEGKEPTGSMGDDTPLAVLSRRPRLLYTYFKQLFAQVTNPPIDSIREKSVMSLAMVLGGRLGLFEEFPETSGFVELDSPVLLDHELAALFRVPMLAGRVTRLAAHFDAGGGTRALEPALKDLARLAAEAVEAGAKLIVLSDQALDAGRAAIPMLLAVGAVHQHLVRAGLRLKCDLVAQTGEARDVHQLATLVGFGANAVNPWLALHLVGEIATEKANGAAAPVGPDLASGRAAQSVPPAPEFAAQPAAARENYRRALDAGLLKVMAKMGISTLASYCGSQLFEAIGISTLVIEECFTGTPSPIEGVTYREIAAESLRRHASAFPEEAAPSAATTDSATPPPPATATLALHHEGYFRVNKKGDGEFHAWSPKYVATMTKFVRSPGAGSDFDLVRAQADEHQPVALKDLLRIRFGLRPHIPLDEVEPAEDIRRRFTTAGMSLGALSPEAHETLAIAMNRIGGKSNSGEGGEDPARFSVRENGDSANSAIKQVASGRFGVTAEYLANAREIEIKMAQGAKPGEGGQLPGYKITDLIARLRHSTPGVTLISPPPHHDIYSIEDLAQLIFDLKEVNPRAKVCVKLVACSGVGTVAAGVAKAYADVVLVSGHEGGTGAAPLASVKHAGSSWELGVAEAHHVLMMNGLRNRITLRTDGGMKTGRDIVIAAILGAEEYNFGTAALIAAGCAMFRVCHLNTCPVGVTTQREDLRAKFRGKPENVINFFNAVAEDVRHYLAKLGARTLNEIIGRTELLEQIDDPANPKTRLLDLQRLLHNPDPSNELDRYHTRERNERFGHDGSLDEVILQEARDVIRGKCARLSARYKVENIHRDIGTFLSGVIAYGLGQRGLPPGTIDLTFTGSAGQSFGAFLVNGIRLTLLGEANDYVGKGMGGGEIVIRPPRAAAYAWHKNSLIGNTCLYGATSGRFFAAGRAGERFAVRNSGATAVVEGVGDHGCEYMTGGVVVVLGSTGVNFGAGMSGGLAFVYDEADEFPQNINPQMISLDRLGDEGETGSLRRLIEQHAGQTASPHARALLEDWPAAAAKFWKVIPHPPTPETPKPVYQFPAELMVA